MRSVRIELEGFLSYRDRTEVDLSDIGAAAILGPNGSGKTTLVEAIGWALYGQGRGRGPDDYVNPESTRAEVVVVFDLAGGRYRVTRERVAGKSARSSLSLEVWDLLRVNPEGISEDDIEVGFAPIGHPNIADTERAIVDLVGMSFETWSSTSYIGQGKADAFTRKRPAERKALLGEVLELERFGRLADLARTAASEAKAQAAGIETDRIRLEAVAGGREEVATELFRTEEMHAERENGLARRQIEAEEAVAASTEAGVGVSASREALARAGAVRGRLAGLRAEHDGLRIESDRLVEVMNGGPAALQEHAAATAEVAEWVEKERKTERRRDLLETELRVLEADLGRVRERIAEETERAEVLDRVGSACPVCGEPLSEDKRTRLLEEVRSDLREASEIRDALVVHRGDHTATMRALVSEAALARSQAIDAEGRRQAAQRRHEEAIRAEAGLQAIIDRAAAIGPTLDELDAEATALGEVPSIEAAEERLRNARNVAALARSAVEDSMRNVARSSAIIGSLRERMRLIDEADAELDRLADLQVEAEAELVVAETAAQAFGRDGIPALLIETAIPEIEAAANELLETLTGSRLTVSLETLGAKKAGGVRETLEVVVGDDVSERPLEALSAGERQAVDLALRIALSRLLAGRAGRRIEALIIDEGFTAFDESHLQRTVEAFAKLGDTFPMTLVITHLAALAEAFPTRFVVEKLGGSSTVRREG